VAVRGDDKKDDKGKPAAAEGSRADRLKAIMSEYQTAFEAFLKDYRAAKDQEARQAALAKRPDPAKFADRLQKLIDENPKDEVAFDALVWVAQNVEAKRDDAFKALTANHLGSPKLKDLLQSLAMQPAGEEFLRAVIAKAQSADAK